MGIPKESDCFMQKGFNYILNKDGVITSLHESLEMSDGYPRQRSLFGNDRDMVAKRGVKTTLSKPLV